MVPAPSALGGVGGSDSHEVHLPLSCRNVAHPKPDQRGAEFADIESGGLCLEQVRDGHGRTRSFSGPLASAVRYGATPIGGDSLVVSSQNQ